MIAKRNIATIACITIAIFSLSACDSKKEVVLMNQSAFTSVIEDYCVKYKQTINEAGATQRRKERKFELSKFSAIFQDWKVYLVSVGTDKKGNANVKFSVYTDGQCSRIEFLSTISPKHNSYQFLTQIASGNMVKISGSMPFDKGNYHFFKEDSYTERGAMLDPEFIVKISRIGQ
jgi:hypothetical protein